MPTSWRWKRRIVASKRSIPARRAGDRRARMLAAAQSFAPAILTSLVITALSFLPVLRVHGRDGRLLRPLALTKTLVVASAALVTLTLAPALRDRLLRGRVIRRVRQPADARAGAALPPVRPLRARRPALTLATAGLALISCLPILGRLGGEFLPRVDEGDLLYMPTTLPGVAADQAALQLFWQDFAMSQFDEVGDGVRQGRPRRHRHRSRAVLDGRDDDPAAPARRVAEDRRASAGTRAGCPPRCSACCVWSGPTRRRARTPS